MQSKGLITTKMKNAIYIIVIVYCLLRVEGYAQTTLTPSEKTVALTILAEAREGQDEPGRGREVGRAPRVRRARAAATQ